MPARSAAIGVIAFWDETVYEQRRIKKGIGLGRIEFPSKRERLRVTVNKKAAQPKVNRKIGAVAHDPVTAANIDEPAGAKSDQGKQVDENAIFIKLRKDTVACRTNIGQTPRMSIRLILLKQGFLGNLSSWRGGVDTRDFIQVGLCDTVKPFTNEAFHGRCPLLAFDEIRRLKHITAQRSVPIAQATSAVLFTKTFSNLLHVAVLDS